MECGPTVHEYEVADEITVRKHGLRTHPGVTEREVIGTEGRNEGAKRARDDPAV